MEVVEAHLEGSGSKLELVCGEWPRPSRGTSNHPQHCVLFHLPPIAFTGEGRFPEFGQSDFRPLAPIFFRPANVVLEGAGTGGRTRFIRYTFTPERMRSVVEKDVDWGRRELENGLDLDGTLVGPALLRLMQEAVAPGFASAALADALGVTAIVELLRRLGGDSSTQSERGRLRASQLALIRERILTPSSTSPTVAELAQLCGMSDRTLLRLFRKTTGMTIAAFVRNARINEARALLCNTNLTLKEIAFRLGFTSHSSFTAVFHREVGCTPFDCRRDHRRSYHSA